jgi:tetratricopeptide (TPR) repeat protein
MMNRILLAVALLAVSSSRVGAQAPDATALEASGNKHFELAEYDAAIADFKEAFRVSDAPNYLFNIAQAYRLKKDCRSAATFYKTYLRRVPDAPNAAKVRDRIAEMDTCAATQPAPPPTPTEPPPPTEPTPPTASKELPPPPPPPEHPAGSGRAWMKYTSFAAVGVGAVGLGLGVKFMLDGESANDDLKDKCSTLCTSEAALAIQEDGKAANRNAVIFGVAGGVFVAAGVVLFVMSRSGGDDTEATGPAVSVTSHGATAAYGWRF